MIQSHCIWQKRNFLLSRRQWRWGRGCMLFRTRSRRPYPSQPPDRNARTRSGRREEWEGALGSEQHWGRGSDGDGTDKIPIFPPPEDGCSPKPPKSSYRPPPYSHSPHAVSECLSGVKLLELTEWQTKTTPPKPKNRHWHISFREGGKKGEI